MKASSAIRNFVEHPLTNLFVGLLLFGSGFVEAYESLHSDLKTMNFGAHHGLMLFGTLNVLASIPDIIEGIGSGASYIEHRAKRHQPSDKDNQETV
ncbi:hypothetical protein [Microbulbifer spongiae]|uniref:Uncharacterized protein n=1 Tax=Microbulbifer spongiae TaxID=2944933 RepID=A0ABY9EDY5_9GAMM|nr:hypothetical protein [Microbulbifer sp. MI-G]WKD51238.1 hypothetical protein M8T91_07425 [Microbulbifer sp. MI-G]